MRFARGLVALVVAGCLSGVTVLLLAGSGPWSGPVLFAVTEHHGMHRGDVAVLAMWLVGTIGCAWLARPGRP